MNGGIHDGFNIAEKLASVIQGKLPEGELDRYERQRRPVALEYVNQITIANKRNLEARDPEQHRLWKVQMTRIAADPALAREYMLKTSMIASLRRSECA
jgi:3-(3-hydroxy-phenyl)propionate hydroxylase